MTRPATHRNSAARTTKQPRLPPLENGDHLDQKTFHKRYEAMPPHVKAELIGGIVYISSPVRLSHGQINARLIHWLGEYEDSTPGTMELAHTTSILGPDSEPEPDSCLLLSPGGKTCENTDEYLEGAPEWIGEIAYSSESIDLHRKKADYEKAGIQEYMVAALRQKQVFWFVNRRGKFQELKPGMDGIIRSEVFPGLWLEPEALLNRNRKRLLDVLRQGLDTPEHAAFVAKLAAK